MKIGNRKVVALVGLAAVAAAGVVVDVVWDRDGLLWYLIAILLFGITAIGWLVASSTRRIQRHIDESNAKQLRSLRESHRELSRTLDGSLRSAGVNGQISEQLLRALQSGFSRLEVEWEATSDQLQRTVDLAHERTQREVQLLERSVDVTGREVRSATTDLQELSVRLGTTTGRVEDAVEVARSAYAQMDATVRTEFTRLTRRETQASFRRLIDESVSEMDALLQLRRRFPVADNEPILGGWAIGAGAILYVLDELERSGDLVVECGPGASTVYIAEFLRRRGHGRVVSFEHDERFLETVNADLRQRGLSDHAEVRHAPLVEMSIGETTALWYDTATLEDLVGIDILLVDGPPQATGELARYPALPVFNDRLGPDALVVLDDAHRSGEQQAIARWVQEFSWEERLTPPGGFAALRRIAPSGTAAH